MKHIKLFLMALAVSTCGLASATIYLTKEGKVVASYEDEEVDAITFEDPTEYLIDCKSIMMHQIYYGDAVADRGYNYALILADSDYDNSGQLPMASKNFMFRFNAPEPKDPSAPLLPEGTYKLNADPSEPWSILPGELSYAREGLNLYYYDSATFTISYDEAKGMIYATLNAVDTEGNHIKTEFAGSNIYLQNYAIKWYDKDVNINGGTLIATYLDFQTGFDMNVNMNITIADNGYQASGWPNYPSNVVTFVGNVKLDDRGHFVPSTWEILDAEVAKEGTLLAGRTANLMGSPFPVNTHLLHYYNADNVEAALVKSGSATIEETSSGVYKLTYDFVTHTGNKLQGVYEGEIKINGLPQGNSFGLTSNYELDLEGAEGTFKEWSDGECQIDLHFFNQNYQYYNDRLALQIKSKNGKLEPGIYKVNNDGASKGTIVPGVCTPNFKTGSFFIKYDSKASEELKGAGIGAGQIEIIDNGDGTWTIKIDLRDDTRDAHKITGTWTGPVTVQ